jgi:hypothetical protein
MLKQNLANREKPRFCRISFINCVFIAFCVPESVVKVCPPGLRSCQFLRIVLINSRFGAMTALKNCFFPSPEMALSVVMWQVIFIRLRFDWNRFPAI